MRLERVLLLVCLAAGCGHKLENPKPSLASVTPDLVCSDQLTTAVVIAGDGLTPLPTKTLQGPEVILQPAVTLSPVQKLDGSALTGTAVTIADDPAAPAASHVRWESEMQMSFDVTPGVLAPGVYDLTVTNLDKQAAHKATALAVVPPPVITRVVPPNICDAQGDQTVMVNGTNFLKVGAAVPSLVVKDATGAAALMPAPTLSACAHVAASVMTGIQECTVLTVTVPKGGLPPGMYTLTVTNPAPAACASTDTVHFVVEPPPTIDTVLPPRICAGGGAIGLHGSGYLAGATVSLANTANPTPVKAGSVVVMSPTDATATFGGGGGFTPGDVYDVTYLNADGCTVTRPQAVTVVPGPLIFYVDPPFVYGGITTPTTIYTTGITIAAASGGGPLPAGSVVLTPSAGGAPIDLSAVSRIDPNHPKHVIMNVSATVPAGTYDLKLTDDTGCPAFYTTAVTVVTQKTTLKAVTPPFGFDQGPTAVSITATAAFFEPGVRAYLAPHGGASPTATPLSAVELQSPTEITATVVASPTRPLADGAYDVIVVNPDGTIGFLDSGFTVVPAPPPVILGLSPGSLPTNCAPCTATLTGTSFVPAAPPTVTASCLAPGATTPTTPAVTVASAPAATTSALTLNLTLVTTLPGGTVCSFRETQAGVFADGGTLVVTIPSANLTATSAGPNLGTARRAPGLAFNGPTSAARYLYALGGDNASGALASVELAKVDPVHGGYAAWATLPGAGVKAATQGTLNAPRTLAAAVSVGRFIYLVGGSSSGATPASLATVERSEVLDPAEAPQIADADLSPDPTDGLLPGLYFYRVSAVMAAGDPNNPDGESLAGDEFAINVPSFGQKKIQTTIVWGAGVAGAARWRIYRTSAPNAAPGSEDVVFETAGASPTIFVDKGATMTPFTAGKPLPFGALGTWKAIGALTVPRAGAGVTVAEAAGHNFLYAGFGYDSTAAGAAQFPTSYDFMQVDLAGNTLTETAWSSHAIGAAGRWQLGAVTASPDLDPKVGATTYVYFGTGSSTVGGNVSGVYDVGSVPATGVLAGVTGVNANGTHGFGYGAVTAVDTIFQLGGNVSGGFTDKMDGASLTTAPTFGTFGPQGGGTIQAAGGGALPLYLPGALVGGAYFWIVGGGTGALPGTASNQTFFDLY